MCSGHTVIHLHKKIETRRRREWISRGKTLWEDNSRFCSKQLFKKRGNRAYIHAGQEQMRDTRALLTVVITGRAGCRI